MCYDNILDKKLLKCNYFMVYLDRWCNIKVWGIVLINGIYSDWIEWFLILFIVCICKY